MIFNNVDTLLFYDIVALHLNGMNFAEPMFYFRDLEGNGTFHYNERDFEIQLNRVFDEFIGADVYAYV